MNFFILYIRILLLHITLCHEQYMYVHKHGRPLDRAVSCLLALISGNNIVRNLSGTSPLVHFAQWHMYEGNIKVLCHCYHIIMRPTSCMYKASNWQPYLPSFLYTYAYMYKHVHVFHTVTINNHAPCILWVHLTPTQLQLCCVNYC